MTSAQLANIVLRLFGALWFVSGLMALPQLLWLPGMTPEAGRSIVIASALSSLLFVVVGAAIYRGSEALAARMFPSDQALSIGADPIAMQEAAYGLLAVYLGIDALGRIGGLLYAVLQSQNFQDESRLQSLWGMNRESLVTSGVEFLASVALFLGKKGMARLARGVRSTPVPPS